MEARPADKASRTRKKTQAEPAAEDAELAKAPRASRAAPQRKTTAATKTVAAPAPATAKASKPKAPRKGGAKPRTEGYWHVQSVVFTPDRPANTVYDYMGRAENMDLYTVFQQYEMYGIKPVNVGVYIVRLLTFCFVLLS